MLSFCWTIGVFGNTLVVMEKNEDYIAVHRVLEQTKLKDVMTTNVISVHENEHLSVVYQILKEKKFRHIPVVDDAKHLVGLMTEREFFKNVTPHRLEDGTIHYDSYQLDRFILRHLMIKEPFTLVQDDSLATAVVAMSKSKYGCVPVIDESRQVVGIITQADILKIAASFVQS